MEYLKQKKHNYEIMYIVDNQNEEKKQLIKKELYEILIKNDGQIIKEKDYIHQFAYPINKKTKGHYFIVQTLTSSENILNFNRIFLNKKKQLDIMRFMVINIDNEKINKFKIKNKIESNYLLKKTKTSNYLISNNNEINKKK